MLKELENVSNIEEAAKLFYVSIKEIKEDCEKGIILDLINKCSCITVSDEPATPENSSLLNIYLEAKEIVVQERNHKMKAVVDLSDKFDLSIKNSEMTYFLLVMYYFGMKLNDTYPMIPALFKNLLRFYVDLSFWGDVVKNLLADDEIEWKEPECDKINNFENDILLNSLNPDFKIDENLIIKITPKKSLYISEKNKNKINLVEGLIYSKYLPLKHCLIIVP